ncbi:MAG: Histidine kinase [Dehalococcoidales bacterium]|nr:Histidine kinase [Dehalococcoidales bacterium]
MASLANLSLQKRITLLALSGLVAGLGLFSWLGIQSVNESIQRILDERLMVARAIVNRLDYSLADVLMQLNNVNFSGVLPLREQFAPVAVQLRRTLEKSGISTHNVIVIDRGGRITQVEPEDSRVLGIDISGYPAVRQALETGVPTISGLISSSLAVAPVVFATVPIASEDGSIIGALATSIDIEQSRNDAFRPDIVVGETGYTEIVDGNGIVLARSRPGAPPKAFETSDHPGRFAALVRQREAIVATCHRCHETPTTLERRRDVLAFVPLATTSWGVAIRQSEKEALAPALRLQQRLLLIGLIVLLGTLLLVWTVMQGIVRPIKMLTSATKRVAGGDFKAVMTILPKRKDEIGQLSAAFYDMTRQLAESRDELVLSNKGLSALNSIAVTVSQSLNLEEVLANAIQKVLEITKATSGCVFLQSPDGDKLERMSYLGSAEGFCCQGASSAAARCACHQVLRSGRTLLVNDVSQCPMLGENTGKEGINCFVTIPLKSQNRTLGVMNIAGPDELYFTEHDFQIVDSIGRYIGLAIENSILYEEAKQKEKLRGELLSSVINAQEEERKRIARELHDEYGQMLTGLMMSIETLEGTAPAGQTKFIERLKNAKSLIARALKDMRRLTVDLRPSALDDLGLVAAIRSYAQANLEDAGIKVQFESKGLNGRLSATLEIALFRIVQEALHNITKHAEAHHVRIHLEAEAAKVTAIVEDDGKGFNVDAVFKPRKSGRSSFGLLGIQERAALLGGVVTIESKAGQGTRLVVKIPTGDLLGGVGQKVGIAGKPGVL